jgi:hypothetical protein
MKISPYKNSWTIETPNTVFYLDPQEKVQDNKKRQIIGYTKPLLKSSESKDPFVIDGEGRFEIGDFFVEGLYINKKRERLSFYIANDQIRALYVGQDLDTKGEDSQENLGDIDLLIIRPEEEADLDKVNNLLSHYDPAKMLIFLDKVSEEKKEKITKFFNKESGDILDKVNFRPREMKKEEDDPAEIVLLRA